MPMKREGQGRRAPVSATPTKSRPSTTTGHDCEKNKSRRLLSVKNSQSGTWLWMIDGFLKPSFFIRSMYALSNGALSSVLHGLPSNPPKTYEDECDTFWMFVGTGMLSLPRFSHRRHSLRRSLQRLHLLQTWRIYCERLRDCIWSCSRWGRESSLPQRSFVN